MNPQDWIAHDPDPVTAAELARCDGAELAARFARPLSFGRIYPTGEFVRAGGTCATSTALNPGRSCTVIVKFAPLTRGTRVGTITFEDNAPGSPHSVLLSGIGTVARGAATATVR